MKKAYLSSLFLLSSSVFGVTFEPITLSKIITTPLSGTRIEYSTFYPMMVTELRKDDVLLTILEVKTVDQMLEEWVTEDLKRYWLQKVKVLSTSGGPSKEGLIPIIEIPVKFPAPIVGIFGEGGRLEIGGSQSITFGGSKNYTVEAVADPNVRQTWFPDLKMEQHLKVNVKGTIGEKLSVDVDHDSKRESDLKNRIKLVYTGREDEIVQKVEAGDISLSLPSTRYSSVSGKHEGLFGIKTFNQIGPLSITAIASKEQGEASSELYKGYGGRVESLRVDDYLYVKRKFYWLGEHDTIIDLEVFRGEDNPTEWDIEAEVLIDPTNPDSFPELIDTLHFKQLERGKDYIFNPGNWIELTFQLMEEQALAVYYTTKSGEVGDLISSPVKKLKLIKPDYRTPWHYTPDGSTIVHPTWEYELKNFYSLGAENIIDTSIYVTIWEKRSQGSDIDYDTSTTIHYIELLGLDENGDGRIELKWIHNDRYLVFPFHYFPDGTLSPKPFFYLPDGEKLPNPDSAIYYETNFNRINPKYYIIIQYQTSQPTISLPRINIIEESEVVKVGDEVWQRGRDYDIDYLSGTITLKRIPQPQERLFIDYQWAPLISLASKSLLGIRGAYEISDIGEIGSTFLFRSVTTPTEKPKPGEEPTRNMLAEMDGNLTFKPAFLTSLANLMPFVCTDKSSELSISGEVAASFPNPNTKNQAYLDDMEGTVITHGFPVNFKAWIYGSVPVDEDTSNFASVGILWYNPEDGVRAGDIHEGLPPEERERRETILQLEFQPDDISSWSSLSTLLSPTRLDLRTYDFLEVWVKGDEGKLSVDLAPKLSEDGIRRNKGGEIRGYETLDTEDKEPRDGILDWDEDTGLDGVEGKDEQWNPLGLDDGNDDYHWEFGSADYSRVNGTEGNDKLDTEDLDGDNRLDTENSYFEYEIDLSDTLFQEKRTAAGWKLYRIPLNQGESVGSGFPDSANVKYGRIWVTGASEKVIIQIYSIDIVGNRWINQGVSKEDTLSGDVDGDEKFYVEVVSNVYDTTYVPPFDPGVDRYGRPMRESSLRLIYENVRPGHRGFCYHTIIDPNAKDLTNYNSMAVWLKKEKGPSVDFFIRFGSDTLNYYEMRKTMLHSQWEEVRIELKELPLIKHSVYDTTSATNLEYHVGELGFKGKPSLTKIEWMSIGIVNADSTIEGLTGNLYVNDMRLINPKRNVGVAANLKLDTRVADLIALSLSTEKRDSEFRRLTETAAIRAGTKTTTNYSFTGTMNLHKFGLESFSIPIKINMGKTVGLPKYGAGNDVELESEQRWRERTESSNLSYSLNFSKSTTSENPLLKLALDPLKIGINRLHRLTDTPDNRDSSSSFASSVSYSYSPNLKPLNLRLFHLSYFPDNIRFSGGYNSSYSLSWNKTDTLMLVKRAENPRSANYSVDLGYSPISSLRSSYKFSARRNLNRTHLYRNVNIGKEWQRNQTLTMNYDLPLPIFKPRTSYSIGYDETHHVAHKATLTDSTEYINVSSLKKVGTSFYFDVFEIFDKLPWLRSKKGGLLSKLRNIISPPNFSYSRSINSQAVGLLDRPSLSYQLGIKESIGEIERESNVGKQDRQKISDTYSINGGISFWKLSIKGGGEKRKSENIFPSAPSNNTWSVGTTWPQLTLDINLLGLMGPFSRFLNSISLTSRYSMQQDKSGAPGALKNIQKTHSLSPSLRLTFRKGVNTNISYSYSEKKDQMYDLSRKSTNYRRDALDLTLSYSFSAPTGINLPLLNRIRFKSNLDTSLTGSWGQDLKTQISADMEEPLEIANSMNFSASSSLSYRFSSAVYGSLTTHFRQTRNRKRGSTNRDLGVEFSATFRF